MLTIHYKAVICTTHAVICTKISNALQCFQLLGSANITMAHIQRIARLENGSIRRVNTMAKAILEVEMPESCKKCPLKYYLDYSERNYPWEDYACIITGKGIADKGRRPNCPLKLVKDKEVE